MPPMPAAAPKLAAIPALRDNYVWAWADQRHALVVDPGDAAPVSQWLQQRDLVLTAILLTHHHPDHVGGLLALRSAWPDARSYGPQDDRIIGVDHRVADGDRIELSAPALSFQVLAVPGHTLSHIVFVGPDLLFCGDTLFSAGCGRLFEGSPEQMLRSLDRLSALPGETLVCCGHEYTADNCRFAAEVEPDNRALADYRDEVARWRAQGLASLPSTIARERAVNPFLRIDQPSVRASLADRRGIAVDADRQTAFAGLRRWKDGFGG